MLSITATPKTLVKDQEDKPRVSLCTTLMQVGQRAVAVASLLLPVNAEKELAPIQVVVATQNKADYRDTFKLMQQIPYGDGFIEPSFKGGVCAGMRGYVASQYFSNGKNLQGAVTTLSKRVPFDVVALQSVYEHSEKVSTLFEHVGLSLKSYRAILPHTDVVEVLKYEGFFYLSLPAKVGSREGRHGLLFLREKEGSALFDPNYGLHVAQTSKGEDAFNALLALRKHYKSAEIEEREGEPLVVTRIRPSKVTITVL